MKNPPSGGSSGSFLQCLRPGAISTFASAVSFFRVLVRSYFPLRQFTLLSCVAGTTEFGLTLKWQREVC
jgi:hypothetical protein